MEEFHPKVVNDTVDHFRITPENTCLESLSPFEIDALCEQSRDDVGMMLNRCVLAVLNSGEKNDDVKNIMARYADFSVDVLKTAGGIELVLENAPLSLLQPQSFHPSSVSNFGCSVPWCGSCFEVRALG